MVQRSVAQGLREGSHGTCERGFYTKTPGFAGRWFSNMSESESPPGHRVGLRAGEWVEVRTAEEILTTLDARGRLDALPYKPEMLKHRGKRSRLIRTAQET